MTTEFHRVFWLLLLLSGVSMADQLKSFRVGVLGAVHRPEHTYSARLMNEALLQLGYRMELVSMPGKRLMSQLNRGQVDGDLIRTVDLSRGFDRVLRVPESIGSICGTVYRLLERPEVNIKQSRRGTVLALYNGAPGASSFFLRHWPAVEQVYFGFFPQGVKMLTHERVHLIAVHDLDREYLTSLSDRPLQPYARFHLEPTYFHVNASYEGLILPLAKTLSRLKQTLPPPTCREGDFSLLSGELVLTTGREGL